MEGLIGIGLFTAAIAAFDLMARKFGVDSRPDFDDPRKPAGGIQAI